MLPTLKILDVNKEIINNKIYKDCLKKYKLVIIRNFFTKKEIVDQVEIFRRRKVKLVKKSGNYFVGKENFSRFDNTKIVNKFSTYSRNQYLHTLFSWNNDKSFKIIFNKLIKLRNKILDISSKKYIFTYRKKKFINIPKVLHYTNGSFLDKHVDFNYDNDSNFIIVASQKKLHFDKGGLSYEINKKYTDIEDFLQIGDIICNDYRIKHGVKKIRLKKNQIGRFSLVLSMHQL